jgi:hypothetical protein
MGAEDGMFVGEPNGALMRYWGCQLPGSSHSSVPSSDVALLEAECSGNAACKGYYAGGPSKGTWLISTDTEPSECASLTAQEYPYFWRKKNMQPAQSGPAVAALGVPPVAALGVPPVAALGVPPVSVAASPVIVEETIVLVEETNVDGSPVYTPVPTND